MNIQPPIVGGTIQVYKYESFNYLITPTVEFETISVVNSPEIPNSTLSNINNDAIQFSANPYTGIASANSNSITVTAYNAAGSNVQQTTFPVALNAARFFPPGNNVNYTFYRNEPIVPISFVTPLTLNLTTRPVVSAPTIPVGLSFVQTSANSFDLSGTPVIQSVLSNYKVIGTDISGRTITSTIGIIVNPERMLLDISGSTTIPMDIGSNINPITVSARFPPYPLTGGNIQYKWSPALPGGTFVFRDYLNNPVIQPFVPLDASSSITLTGAIDSNTIQTLAVAGIKNYPVVLTGTRVTSPNINNTVTFNFTLNELVLFNSSNLPTLYVNVPTSNTVFFEAKTYLANVDTSITNIINLNLLPNGLSGFFDSNRARFYLNGTPTSTSYTPFTLRAINGNGVSRDIVVSNLSILNDTVNFNYSVTPAIDTCYNFIQYRPITNGKTGYYPSVIQFRANSGSGCNVTMTSTALSSRTDISLSPVGSNLYQLTGSPEVVDSLTTLDVTATSTATAASATTTVKFLTSPEQYFFSSNSVSGIQNVAITPVQLSVTTLSERPVVGYSSTSLPAGLTLSTSGLISGAPTSFGSGNITYTATTGYSASNTDISYNIIQDNILIAMAQGSETVSTTNSFSGVDFRGITYSGVDAVMQSANIVPYQGPNQIDLSMGPTGLLSGNLTTVQDLFPRYAFTVAATAGAFNAIKTATLTISNAPTPRHLVLDVDDPSAPQLPPLPFVPPQASVRLYNNYNYVMNVDSNGNVAQQLLTSWSTSTTLSNLVNVDFGNLADYAQSGNTISLVAGPIIYRSPDRGNTWTQITNITKLSNINGPVFNNPPFSPSVYPDPIFPTVATNGSGTFVSVGIGYDKSNNFSNIVRVSSNDGISWQDYAVTAFTDSNVSSTRIYYNNGRYFMLHSSNVIYSDSPTTSWTSSNLMNSVSALAFSNNTVIAVGSNGGTNSYISSNNGNTWSALTTPMDGVGKTIEDILYADGRWLASVKESGFSSNYYSTNTTTWNNLTVTAISSTVPRRIVFDGNAWTLTSDIINSLRLEGTCNVDLGISAGIPFNNIRKASFTTLSNGTPVGIVTIPYDSSGYFFASPTQSNYTFYQFCSIQPIPVEVSPSTSNFIYYYASGLPQGLKFIRDTSGIRADISGMSTKYSDPYSNVALFANIPNEGYIVAKTVGMQTVVPRLIRQQDGASSYTSLVRQYVEVNAAQNARDNKVFPTAEKSLGEFMSPEAPDVVSPPLPCDC
jgi:hypothetical protein